MNNRTTNLNSYSDYLKSDWWQSLREKHIYGKEAKCWVCGKQSNLLLHHVRYDHLYEEKLYRDIYVLDWDCHERAHFYFFKLMRIPLTKRALLRRLRFLKVMRSFWRVRPLPFIYYSFRLII